jgi:hypothetical protein
MDIYVTKAKIDTSVSTPGLNPGASSKGFMGFYNSNVNIKTK